MLKKSYKKYINQYKGLNSRLDEIQAAVLRVKLKRLDADNEHRREIAHYYIENIKHPEIVLPFANSKQPIANSHIFHLFVIRTPHRDQLQQYLIENGIQTLIHYPIPPHKQLAYKEWNNWSFPITELIHNQVLSLPMSPILTKNEVEKVIKVINEY